MLALVTEMLSHEFMRNAFLAGTAVAVACGLAGSFILLRGQLFAGDALSHVAFTGTLAALLLGVDGRLGLYGGTVGVAALLALLGSRARADDVAIGSVFAFVLGVGVLLLSMFTATMSGANSSVGTAALFGSILGLDTGAVRVIVSVGALASLALVVVARPLLFATLDEGVAAARGVPTRALGVAFLVIVGVVAAEAAQAVGALLLLGLLAAPAAAAQVLVRRPYVAMALAVAVAVGAMWLGLAASFALPSVPPSFAVIALAAVSYAVAGGYRWLRPA
ncbi:MAG: metal ABC transporter permease [Dehalococcoidia bacterium]